jgi:N-methylhydantoinase A
MRADGMPAPRAPQAAGRYRVGIDIGGTFTDFVVLDGETGRMRGIKVPTVPSEPVAGVLAGLDLLAAEFGVKPAGIEYFVHGTTIAVNTLIERKGAKLGMLVTKGFRDLLLIQRLRIPNTPAWHGDRPTPLIPRERVLEIDERIAADGTAIAPIGEASLRAALMQARAQNVGGLVVCFLHSYRNASHEKAARNFLAREAPDLFVCCSHEVWPRMREYERAIIAIVNAYIMPPMDRYLGGLEHRLRGHGVSAKPYITRSNGGIMTASSARRVPADTLMSGPAAGTIGAAAVARQAGLRDFVTLDIGGTSADVAVIEAGQPQISQNEHVADFPITMPVIGVSSIGAGGGSVARLDEAGVLSVGPDSVGSDPGPACYGRGNTRPAVTDAFLVGGYLNPDNFAAGRMALSRDLAEEAVGTIAEGLGVPLVEAAEAILAVATASIYAELSNLAAARGIALRDYALVPFGGAGPLLACAVAEEVGIARILVPAAPGTLCALGALSADIAGDFIESVALPLGQAMPQLREAHARLAASARRWLAEEAPAVGEHATAVSADMRYIGQSFEIAVALDPAAIEAGDRAAIAEAFHRTHRKLFTHANPDADVEVIDLRVRISAAGPRIEPQRLAPAAAPPLPAGSRRLGRVAREVPVHRRSALLAGHAIEGPALVDQDDTTVFVAPGWRSVVHDSGSLMLERVAL